MALLPKDLSWHKLNLMEGMKWQIILILFLDVTATSVVHVCCVGLKQLTVNMQDVLNVTR